jgi:ankyrin repeat protein
MDGKKPVYVPPSLAGLSVLSGTSVKNRLAARKAATVADTTSTAATTATIAATTAVPINTRSKEERKKIFNTLIQICETPEVDLLSLLDAVDYPFDTIEDKNTEPSTPLSYAVQCNKLEVAERIIDKIIAVKIPSSHVDIKKALVPLIDAIRKENIAAIKLLANKWFSKIHRSNLFMYEHRFLEKIFYEALKTKNLALISELVSSKKLPYYESNSILYYAVQKGYIEAAVIIIDIGGVDINEIYFSNSPIMLAVKNNNIPMVLLLLNKGANTYSPPGYKQPIEIALDNKNIEMMRLLLDKGAVITTSMRDSLTKLPKNANNSREIIAFLQPYLAAQEVIPTPSAAITASNITTPRPVATFGIQEEDGMPILTIPQGSLLYNSFYVKVLKDPRTGAVDLNAVLKTLGGLMPLSSSVTETVTGLKITGCADKFSQKFFYTNPVGGAALMNVLGTDLFNVTATFQTKRDMRLALLMTPGPFHRLEDMNSKPHPALYVCSESKVEDCECAPLVINANSSHQNRYRADRDEKCKFGFNYDVCISPEFLHGHNLDGHIAIAGGDSYEDRFKEFQTNFNGLGVEERYKILSDLIFNRCMSVDRRSSSTIRGFPELVIQIFGTDWYSAHSSQRFEHEIPLDTLRVSDETKVRALVGFLLDFNSQTGPTAAIPIQSPLQLIRIATEYNWYNFETGASRNNSLLANLTVENKYYRYFMANLEAYFNGDLRFIVDPRTGFLIRPGHLPPVLLSNRAPISYEAMSFGTATGPSELSISARARFAKTSGWHTEFGEEASENMLELEESDDIDRNTNMEGGAQFRKRRMPNTVLRKARTPRNTIKNKASTRAVVSVRRNTRQNKPKSTIITLDGVYNIYMEEIRKHTNIRNNTKNNRKGKWNTKKNIKMRN